MVKALIRRRQWHPTPVLLPGKSHGQRSLVGCSPWGRKESDMTEPLHFHFSLLCIGEGNGKPLQCSSLENPRDGVAQSRTRLKWLRSSSSKALITLRCAHQCGLSRSLWMSLSRTHSQEQEPARKTLRWDVANSVPSVNCLLKEWGLCLGGGVCSA